MHHDKFRFAVVASALLFLCSAIVLAEHSRSTERDKRDILALEDRWLASEDDPDVLKTILAEDFIHVLPMGFVTKYEQLSYMEKTRGSLPQREDRHFEDMHVRVYGDVGVVNGIVVESSGNGTQKTVFTDVFVSRKGQWQAVNAQELPFQKSIPTQP